MNAYAHTVESPIGPLTVVVNGEGALTHILFPHHRPAAGVIWDADRCAAAAAQLREYFAGERTDFDLPLAPEGSDFQRRVWEALRGIRHGEVVDYGGLGARIGRAGAARAVGRANATNPIPIVIPCHRVIGADGSLTGYAGGLDAKLALLRLEGCEVRGGRVARAVAA
ncbi:MAG TPA: methylated-DNA--[protein]-cysteine S-methyltransferase [Longimicrobium sp.]|nr:methylated-DNA--[protein]-cysteine S-methyltransferase [Longimicrobium sp.]